PDAIVHCAAERKPDEFEKNPEKSMFLNVDVTRHLAELAGKMIALSRMKNNKISII
ncbi:unnamed protein product, partial [Rotaria magnacalcarata]